MSLARQSRQPARGFSLLEALIALVIVMVGLLGIAGLQALAVRNSAQAHIRTLAGTDARSLAAAMRVNAAYWDAPAAASVVSISMSGTTPSISNSTLASAPDCVSQSCSTTESAAYSLSQWAQALTQLPSNASASISRIAIAGLSGYTYNVTVSWTENNMAEQNSPPTASELQSTTVVVKP